MRIQVGPDNRSTVRNKYVCMPAMNSTNNSAADRTPYLAVARSVGSALGPVTPQPPARAPRTVTEVSTSDQRLYRGGAPRAVVRSETSTSPDPHGRRQAWRAENMLSHSVRDPLDVTHVTTPAVADHLVDPEIGVPADRIAKAQGCRDHVFGYAVRVLERQCQLR
jgi:hypothetical protein